MTNEDAIAIIKQYVSPAWPPRYYEAIAVAISALSRDRWISVEEALPEENGRYLVVLKRYGFVDDIKLNDEQIRILRYHDGWRLPYHVPKWINETLKQEVTHWKPLPEPPKEDT